MAEVRDVEAFDSDTEVTKGRPALKQAVRSAVGFVVLMVVFAVGFIKPYASFNDGQEDLALFDRELGICTKSHCKAKKCSQSSCEALKAGERITFDIGKLEWKCFCMWKKEESMAVTCNINSNRNIGDAELYMNWEYLTGAQTFEGDCIGQGSTSSERCSLTSSTDPEAYIWVEGWEAEEDVNLICNVA